MLRLVRSLLGTLVCLALLLFLPAGNWDWPRGWLFFAAFTATAIVCVAILEWVNPEVLVARMRLFGPGTKRWDAILVMFLIPCVVAIVPVAALDDGRFHWFPVPWSVCALGYVLLLVGFGGSTWVEDVNKFAEPSVRIQTDRGHAVVKSGPYATVRHPLYSVSFPLVVGAALALGSIWALIPAGIGSVLLILRTRWEDRTLQAELPGYKEYAERVRFKLFPGVW
jgi:protein-S-isoprenylcysteine O-methyltransferase Ste14